jgi:hypothetical protein
VSLGVACQDSTSRATSATSSAERKGAASSHWFTRHCGFVPIPGAPTFPEDDHRVTVRVTANQLQAESCEIAERLTRRLFRAIRQPEFPDPLALT